jgi:probable F420-dependent oxidoreductase
MPAVFNETLEQTLLAERLGYGSALVCEHHLLPDAGYFPQPLIAVAGLASATKKIRVGTGVMLLPLYHPLHVAEMGASIDVMSNGRLILGVGQGYRPEEFGGFGVSLHNRGALLEENVKMIRDLWTKDKVAFHGKFHDLPEVTLSPKPVQKPSPPIWVAAKSEAAVRRAARICDAYFMDPVTPLAILKQRRQAFNDESKKVGRDHSRSEVPLFREAYIGKTDDEAWKDVLDPVLHIYKEYYLWGHMQDESGNPVDPKKVSYEQFLELLRKRFIIGGLDTCLAQIEKYRNEVQVDHMIFRIHFPGLSHEKALGAIRLFADKVFPHFN